MTITHEYYVLNLDPNLLTVFEFIDTHGLKREVHLNRTRFWVPTGPILTEFLLCHGDHCARVDPTLDLVTGFRKNTHTIFFTAPNLFLP